MPDSTVEAAVGCARWGEFMKTLKREEIYANQYDDLEHLRASIEEFIERYYNRQRVHSALGLRCAKILSHSRGTCQYSVPELCQNPIYFSDWG